MFKCNNCKQSVQSKPHRIVVEKRQQTYNNQGHISKGWEIVREANLCDDCYEEQPIREQYQR